MGEDISPRIIEAGMPRLERTCLLAMKREFSLTSRRVRAAFRGRTSGGVRKRPVPTPISQWMDDVWVV